MSEKRIADLFQIQKRYLRSAHLERDFCDESALDGYILTDHVKTNLERIAIGLSPFSGQRAWRITGDYGSGKSSFALVLANLLSGRKRNLSHHIQKAVNFNKLGIPVPHFVPVLVTGSRESLSAALLRSLLRAMQSIYVYNKGNKVIDQIKSLLNTASSSKTITDDAVMEMVTEANSFIKTSRKGTGLLIILDELGKFLEFAALHPDRQDVYFLQKLGEIAARSGKSPLFVVGLLHQGFNAYADQLSQSAQKEWEKVAGRFEELIFRQPLEQVAVLVENALNVRTRQLPERIISQANLEMDSALDLGWYGAAFNRNMMVESAPRLYPLHPSVIPVLINLFSRFGQNERSLFSFILSNEPFALQEFASQKIGTDGFYRLHHLYDYTRAAFGHRLGVQSYRSRWNHIDSLIESFHSSDETELKILKTVGILNLLDANHLPASEEAILMAISGDTASNASHVRSALKRLQKEKKVLYHRGTAGGYCLWPYTSINLERVYEDASKVLSNVPRISSVIREYLETRPIVARRHYIETGNLRHFEVCHAQISELNEALLSRVSSSDGLILVPLCENEAERRQALHFVNSGIFRDKPSILFALPKPLGNLAGLVQEAHRWQWISENTLELNVDTYASEEVSRQIAESRKILEKRIQSFIGLKQFTEKTELQWFHKGKPVNVSNSRCLLSLLSDVCNDVYCEAPKISNELVNRRSISSAAAAARMRLIERIFQHSTAPLLGMDALKKPPEMSIYLSLFKTAGLHKETDQGFAITEPDEKSDICHVRPSLRRIRDALERDSERRVKISDIYDELRQEPYGVRDGIIPILIAVFAKANEQNLAFYQNGSFISSMDSTVFQRIIKAPETFEIQHCKIAGVRADLFEKLIALLGLKPIAKRKAELLDVVKPLCSFVAQLPPYVLNTKKLSSIASTLRNTIISAREPVKLIFTDLPAACGFEPFSNDDHRAQSDHLLVKAIKSAVDELRAAYPALLSRIRERLREAFDLPGQFQQLKMTLAERADKIKIGVTEPTLKAFCFRLIDDELPETEWLESIGSFIALKPPSKWHDQEEEVFNQELIQLVTRFRRVESIVFADCQSPNSGVGIRLSITQANGIDHERVIHVISDEESRLLEIQTQFERLLEGNERLTLAAATRALWNALQKEMKPQDG